MLWKSTTSRLHVSGIWKHWPSFFSHNFSGSGSARAGANANLFRTSAPETRKHFQILLILLFPLPIFTPNETGSIFSHICVKRSLRPEVLRENSPSLLRKIITPESETMLLTDSMRLDNFLLGPTKTHISQGYRPPLVPHFLHLLIT